jgi:hypothetical protein
MQARLWFGRVAFVFAALATAASGMGARAATLDTLYSFCSKRGCTDGTNPSAGLARDPAGNLFGITGSGEDVVYELSNVGGKWKHTALRLRCDGGRCSSLYLTVGSSKMAREISTPSPAAVRTVQARWSSLQW